MALKCPDPTVTVLHSAVDKELMCFSTLLRGPGICGLIRLWEEAHREQRLPCSWKIPEPSHKQTAELTAPLPTLIRHHRLTAALSTAAANRTRPLVDAVKMLV